MYFGDRCDAMERIPEVVTVVGYRAFSNLVMSSRAGKLLVLGFVRSITSMCLDEGPPLTCLIVIL
jgi:hypothetical protein